VQTTRVSLIPSVIVFFNVAFNNLWVISRRWLLHRTRKLSGFTCCQRWCSVPQTQDRANQSWFNPSYVERLATKQPVSMLTLLVWRGRGSNRRHPTTRRTLYPLGHSAGFSYSLFEVGDSADMLIHIQISSSFSLYHSIYQITYLRVLNEQTHSL